MTDRHAGYLVTLAEDIREDDAKEIMVALRMVTGVIAVEPVVGNYHVHVGRQRADAEWRERLLDLVMSRSEGEQT